MNLKDQILYEVHGDIKKVVTKNDIEKNVGLFIKCFLEDAKEYGLTEATELYEMMYGKDVGTQLTEGKDFFEDALKNQLNEFDVSQLAGHSSGLGQLTAASLTKPTFLGSIWNSISSFFKGGWLSLKSVFTPGASIQQILTNFGNFAAANPLFTAIGGLGAVAGVVALKKALGAIFKKMGNKVDKKQQEELLRQENLKKLYQEIEEKKQNKEKI